MRGLAKGRPFYFLIHCLRVYVSSTCMGARRMDLKSKQQQTDTRLKSRGIIVPLFFSSQKLQQHLNLYDVAAPSSQLSIYITEQPENGRRTGSWCHC
jgi:hypothetical protein